MSHSVSKVNVGNNALAVVKIIDYTHGGESFTLAEFGLTTGLQDIILILNPGTSIVPRYAGGGILKLFGSCGSDIPDIPTTVGLNYVFAAIIQGVN